MTDTVETSAVEEPEEGSLPVGDFNFIMNRPVNQYKWVDIPEWGCKVKIKALTKAEQIKLSKASTDKGQVNNIKLEMNLLVYSLVEPRLTFDQVDQLYGTADAKALNRLSAISLAFSGLTEDYIGEAAEDMKS